MPVITTMQTRKTELMKDIMVTEHLIDTYSRLDADRVAQLNLKLRAYEAELLDIMVMENNTWLNNQGCNLTSSDIE